MDYPVIETTYGGRTHKPISRIDAGLGLQHEVAAEIRTMQNFSSHAARNDLLSFIKGLEKKPEPGESFILD